MPVPDKSDKRRNHGGHATDGQLGPSRRREQHAYRLWQAGAKPFEIANTRDPDTGRPLYRSVDAAAAAVHRAGRYMGAIAGIESLRQQQLDQLQAQVLDLNRELQQKHPKVNRGKVIYLETGDGRREPVDDTNVKMQIHGTLLRTQKRIAELTGMDAAQRYELTASIGTADYEARVKALMERTSGITLMPRKPELAVVEAQVVEEQEEA